MTTVEVVKTGILRRETVEDLARFAQRFPDHRILDESTRILVDRMQTVPPVRPSLVTRDKSSNRKIVRRYDSHEVRYHLIKECAAAGLQMQFTYNCDGLGLVYTCIPIVDRDTLTVTARDISVYPSNGYAWRQAFNDELTFTIKSLAVPSDIIFYLDRCIPD